MEQRRMRPDLQTSPSKSGPERYVSGIISAPESAKKQKRPLTDPPPVELEILTDPAAFESLADEWDALAGRCGGGIFYRHGFLRIWRQHFAADSTLRILTQRSADGCLTAVLPLLLRRTRIYGVPVRELSAMANVHSGRFDLLADNPSQAARAFLGLLMAQADWDVLSLIDVPEAGAAESLLDAATLTGLRIGRWLSIDSPYIPLPASWSEMEQSLSSHFRSNLRRRGRRLAEKGKVSVELIDGGVAAVMMARLNEGLQLETEGWKGLGGTAICQSSDTLGFYTALASQAAGAGQLRLWFLRLDGRVIAFQYGLQDSAHYLLLKPAFDETLREVGPGHLLMEQVLKDCIAGGLEEFDFLGPDMPWKRDWASKSRQHAWLYVLRGSRGQLVYWLKFRMAPLLKRLLRRWQSLAGRK